MSIKLSNLFSKSIDVGEETIKDNKIVSEKSSKDCNNNANNSNNDWWIPSKNGKKRIMLCGTYPIGASNGYSKVVYYISKYLGIYDDIELTIYGFQNINCADSSAIRDDIPPSVKIHDAMKTENPRRNGFGELEIGNYIKNNPQDIIIIFNDNIVTTALVTNIMNDCGKQKNNFKLISYMDQVYPYQKKDYIKLLNKYIDGIVAFTPYWMEIAKKLGIREDMPMYSFPHGFDVNVYYPIPTNIARMFFDYDKDAFIVLNLNRNQPRKCWDHTIIAWVEFVEKHYLVNVLNKKTNITTNKHTRRPLKLIIGTSIDAYWDLNDVLENEVKFRNVPLDYVKNTIIEVSKPQQLSDKEINILYNCCDVGCNNCNGGGFELTVFECLALGKPQVSSFVGGIREYLTDNNSTPIRSTIYQYLDNKSVGIGGKAEITDPHDFADAFWKYLSNPELANKHGMRGRENILKHYRWETLVEYFYKSVLSKL
jgi:glycosyltransferase involved in cell wall biosynthesis